MKAEIVLTSSQSKRLFARAILSMDSVKTALKNGVLVVCRGTTNAYICEELLGSRVDKANYTAGYMGRKGFEVNPNPPAETVFVKGQVKEGATLAKSLNDLKPGDVIIKGANAIGPDGIPGVLIGRRIRKQLVEH